MGRVILVLATIISVQATDAPGTDVSGADASGTDLKPNKDETFHHQPEDLGVYGEVFPVQEKSLLEVIQEKLEGLKESGFLETHQKVIAEKTRDKALYPDPVVGVHKTTRPRSFTYDPSLTVPYDLKDHQGAVFYQKGTKVNPLDTHTFKSPFLFVDGDDAKQVNWAIKEHQLATNNRKPKIILVKGAPFDLSRKFEVPVYFDQSGTLVKKLGITQVPARVSQQDKLLLIEELDMAGGD